MKNFETVLALPENFVVVDVAEFRNKFDELSQYLKGFSDSEVSRENRLVNIRFRLSLDLSIGIDTKFSDTKTEYVRNIYVLLYKFVDLWNVYEVCFKSGENLKIIQNNNKCKYNNELLQNEKVCNALLDGCKQINELIADNRESLYLYLSHFSELDSLFENNKKHYQELIQNFKNSEYSCKPEDLMFLMYMERNAFYHGGEAARGGTTYPNRLHLIGIYLNTMRVLIAKLGVFLFDSEKEQRKNEKNQSI